MADYFLSDVHLRHDRPDRGRRLARFVDRLAPEDRLAIVGDLVDFWHAARQRRIPALDCPGLASLAGYRERGGRLMLVAGNHDGRMRDRYARSIGGDWVDDRARVESHGLRLHLAHGHRLGTRSTWKAAMEGRAFFHAFAALPGPVAGWLERRLERTNRAGRDVVDGRQVAILRLAADRLAGEVDVVVLGHVHVSLDDAGGSPRLIVLGSWHHRASYLRVDGAGARLLIESDGGSRREWISGAGFERTDG